MIKTVSFLFACVLSTSLIAQTEIYNENFDAGMPVNYTIVDNDGLTPASAVSEFTSAWIRLADPENTSDTVMGSTSFFDPTGTADRWLITPGISLGTFGNYLHWEAKSHDPSHPDDYFVLVSTTDTQLSSFTDTVGHIIEEFATWTSRQVNLSGYGFDNQTVHVAFVNRTEDGFKLYLDDIRVVEEDPVGIDELSDVQLTVYPNPATDVINVEGADVLSMSVISMDGKQMLFNEKAQQIRVDLLTPGMYFLDVLTDKGISRKRFIKR